MNVQYFDKDEPKVLRKQMLLLAFAVVGGQLMFLLVTSITPPPTEVPRIDNWETIKIVAPLFAIAALSVGVTMFKRRLNDVGQQSTIERKVIKYRSAFMSRLIAVNIGGFLPLIAYFLSRDPFFLAIVVPMMATQILFALQAANEAQMRSVMDISDPF